MYIMSDVIVDTHLYNILAEWIRQSDQLIDELLHSTKSKQKHLQSFLGTLYTSGYCTLHLHNKR